MWDKLLIILAVLVFNVLDSYTTRLGFQQYPDPELKGEGNPIMRKVMLKNPKLAEIIKHGAIGVLVLVYSFLGQYESLRYIAILLGIVVANNTFIVVSRKIAKRKIKSPTKLASDILHIPEKLQYPFVILVILTQAAIMNYLIWGR